MFSHNVVNMVLPKTCEHRGEIKSVESFAGKRGHLTVGHWRLIEGILTPYWTWVDGHKRGNAELGWVTKERHVKFSPDKARRGFLVPQAPGRRGQRLQAVPLS